MLSLLLASLLSFSMFANTTTDDYTFTIHIGAFVKANPSDFEEIKPYGFMYAQRINNLLQIYMGDYPSEGQAMKVARVNTDNWNCCWLSATVVDCWRAPCC